MVSTQIAPQANVQQEPDWPEHFKQWRQSGLTQSEYCSQAGLSRHRFKYWRRKLEPETFRSRRQQKSGFVPLQVKTSPVVPSLSLTLPNGLVVHGIDASNVELVKQLVAQL